jgi:hypothetical protein
MGPGGRSNQWMIIGHTADAAVGSLSDKANGTAYWLMYFTRLKSSVLNATEGAERGRDIVLSFNQNKKNK